MKIHELLHLACADLEKAGVENPAIDAGLLLGNCLDKSRTELYLNSEEIVSVQDESIFIQLLNRRLKREPLAYILGTQEFWSLDFLVDPNVLIPRPETELLLEVGLSFYRKQKASHGLVLDLCSGSGAIAVVLARELGVPVLAVDLSLDALLIAQANARQHGVSHLITFIQADLLSSFCESPIFSLVLTNPPYVSEEDLKNGLQREVGEYEPRLALDGGRKGLEVISRIRDDIVARLLPEAGLFMEIGAEQGADITVLFAQIPGNNECLSPLQIIKDYSGYDRIAHIQKKIH